MQYTQAQIDRANAVSLEDFLRTQGETLIKSGREYRWKEHDSLTVRGNKWFRHSQSKGGYPIDFPWALASTWLNWLSRSPTTVSQTRSWVAI